MSKYKVILSKIPAVNNAVGGCTRLSAANCLPHFIRNDYILLRPKRAGQNIREAKRNGVIAKVRYGHGVDIPLHMFDTGTDHCFFITGDTGQLVPVRDGMGLEAALFSNPLISIGNEKRSHDQKLKNAQAGLKTAQDMLASSHAFLRQSPAYKKGRCVTPKRGRIPPKPRVMSQSRAVFQAGGTCVDLYAPRHAITRVYNALGAIQRRDLIKTHQRWLRANPAQCTRLNISQINSF